MTENGRRLEMWSDFDRASLLLCGNKMPTRWNRWYLSQILLHAQHVLGNTMPIIRSSRVLYRWSLPVVFGALVFRLSVWCGAEGYVSGLQAAETCWACNKICNKYHLLHLVGILFPHLKCGLSAKIDHLIWTIMDEYSSRVYIIFWYSYEVLTHFQGYHFKEFFCFMKTWLV